MKNNDCPCCSQSMLLHLSSRRSYWFCNHCRLEMPAAHNRFAEKPRNLKQLNSATIDAISPLKAKRSVVTVS